MQAVSALQPGQELRLLAPFEPAPLYAVLAGHGLTPSPKQLESGDWEIRFSRSLDGSAEPPARTHRGGSSSRSVAGAESGQPSALPVVDVDARGLEPPEPLVKVLETLARLPDGSALRARTDRRPMHLYSHLEQRGLKWETTEQADGSFVTLARPAN